MHRDILIAGLGSVGRRHLRNLKDLGHSRFILLRSGKGQTEGPEVRGLPTETDLEHALDRRPAAAIVSNPTSLHLDVAIPAAEAGCHLFLEKPVSHDLEGLDDLSRIVERRALRVLVGFQFRFHLGLQAVKSLLEERAIGTVVSAYASWGEYLPDWHPDEDYREGYSARTDLGGGVVLTLCHPIDYLHWLLGPIRSVSAELGRLGLGLEVEDTGQAVLRFESGATGMLHLDYVQRPPEHGLRLVGTEGTIHWDNRDGGVRVWRSASCDWSRIETPVGFDRNTMFKDEMRHFLSCVEGGEAPRVSLGDGIHALRVALAIKAAAEEGRRVEVEEV